MTLGAVQKASQYCVEYTGCIGKLEVWHSIFSLEKFIVGYEKNEGYS